MNVKAASVTQLFIKARSPKRRTTTSRCGLSHKFPRNSCGCGVHAGGLLPQSAWQLDQRSQGCVSAHGRIRLGWEACLKRIRARFQTHDFVGVALR